MDTVTSSQESSALRHSLHTFAREANDAAIALYTIFLLCSAPYDLFGTAGLQRDIAHWFMRISGVLSAVLFTCDLDALPDVVKSHLNAHMESCQSLFLKVHQAVEKLHEHYISSDKRAEKVAPSFAAFGRDVDGEVVRDLEEFFDFALSIRLCMGTKEHTSCEYRHASTYDLGHLQKAMFASLGCLLQSADKSLLRQRSELFEILYPAPPRLNPFAQQKQQEGQRGLQPSSSPQVTCYLFANKSKGTVTQNEGAKITSFPAHNHPSAEFHSLAQPNAVSPLPFGHNRANAQESDSTPVTDSTAQKHPFADFCERGPIIPSQPQTWSQRGGSESELAPPPPVQKHFFPIAGGPPQPRVQSLLSPHPQPQPQPTNIFNSYLRRPTTTTANMSLFGTFGPSQTPAKPAFGGNPSGGGLFGGNPSTGGFGANSSSGGLFGGGGVNSSAGGLFGGGGSSAAGGGFGGNTSGGLFGGNTSSGGFGGNTTGGGLFGGNTSGKSLFGGNTSGGGLFGASRPTTGLFGGQPAAITLGFGETFEAYLLRPYADSINGATTWSYKVETLLVDSAAMQVHTSKLSSTYSVLDAISQLQPQQLHLVQEHVKAREGKLVSVQFGAASNMPTPMGASMGVQSVIFLLKTCKGTKQNQQGFPPAGQQHSCWTPPPASAAQPTGLFGNNANTANANTGGFGSNNNPSKSTLFGGFGGQSFAQSNHNNQSSGNATGLFGSSHNLPGPSRSGPNTGTSLHKSFVSTQFYAKGDEHCTYQEKDGTTGTAMQHYMTLPAYFDNSGKSFEEARAVDYSNGFIEKSVLPQAGGLFGMKTVQNQTGGQTTPGGNGENGASPSDVQQPTSTPHFGGWGQKAAISEGLSIFASPAPSDPTSAKVLNETKGSSSTPSLFASTTTNPQPNPFAASTTPTKPPPANPFANVALSSYATTAGFGQTQASSPLLLTNEEPSGARTTAPTQAVSLFSIGTVDEKFISPKSAFKAAAGAFTAPTSTPPSAIQAQPSESWRPSAPSQFAGLGPFSMGTSTPAASIPKTAQGPSLFGTSGPSHPSTSTSTPGSAVPNLDFTPAKPIATPDAEMSRLLIETQKAGPSSGGDAALKGGEKVEEKNDAIKEQDTKGKKKVSFVELSEEEKDVVKEDAEYDHCGDVGGK